MCAKKSRKGVVPKVRIKRLPLEDGVCSLEQRARAVELYIKYGLRATVTIREFGHLSRAQLMGWHGKRRRVRGAQPRALSGRAGADCRRPSSGARSPQRPYEERSGKRAKVRRVDKRAGTRREEGDAARGVRRFR